MKTLLHCLPQCKIVKTKNGSKEFNTDNDNNNNNGHSIKGIPLGFLPQVIIITVQSSPANDSPHAVAFVFH